MGGRPPLARPARHAGPIRELHYHNAGACSNHPSGEHAGATTWQVQDAEQHFRELLKRSHDEGPQVVEHGQDVAVILDMEEYRRLTGRELEPDFKEFLLSAPDWPDDLEIPRDSAGGATPSRR
ncbi:type II toxin-antitoxin system Phd/YefM family antitoxin [Nonomuraea rubra]|uniref:type II toxin-antitoxin system Phd/YefM family antitoxin n=1 Tax=Nonomuraea rubra TaxID=46180 RepID=UPI0033346AF5